MTPRAEQTHGSRWRATAAVLPAVVPVVGVVGVGGVGGVGGVTVLLQSLGLMPLVGRPDPGGSTCAVGGCRRASPG